ncbi:MAG TPA: M90 family metallopeptidase [Polyangiaceae bacterium]
MIFDFFKKGRRAELRDTPLTDEQRAILAAGVPYLAKLTDEERKEVEGLVQIFLAEKSFEGCGGLELTGAMKLVIAAQACILLLHRENDMYPGVDAILVYPSAYKAPSKRDGGGFLIEDEQARLGESWTRGVVVLAWDAVKNGAVRMTDGHNLVFHEFAHQLDSEDGAMNGAPELETRAEYKSWAHVLGDEYAELSERIHEGKRSDIDAYGATNPAEFFAVVTEMFFEKGAQMKDRHPELYEELAAFYKQDPASR